MVLDLRRRRGEEIEAYRFTDLRPITLLYLMLLFTTGVGGGYEGKWILFVEGSGSGTGGGGGGGGRAGALVGGGGGFWSAVAAPSNVGTIAIVVTAMAGLALAATLVYSRRGSLKSPWSRRRRKHALLPRQWKSLFTAEGRLCDGGVKFLKKVRSGGVDPSIRAEVWPFLLGVYDINSSKEERDSVRCQNRELYENLRKQCLQILKRNQKSSLLKENTRESSKEGSGDLAQVLDSTIEDDASSRPLSTEGASKSRKNSDCPLSGQVSRPSNLAVGSVIEENGGQILSSSANIDGDMEENGSEAIQSSGKTAERDFVESPHQAFQSSSTTIKGDKEKNGDKVPESNKAVAERDMEKKGNERIHPASMIGEQDMKVLHPASTIGERDMKINEDQGPPSSVTEVVGDMEKSELTCEGAFPSSIKKVGADVEKSELTCEGGASSSITKVGDVENSELTCEGDFAGDSESTDTDTSEEPDNVHPFPQPEGVEESDLSQLTEENPSISASETKTKMHTDEDFATWQRIIRLDALRANAEWVIYSPSQATVDETKAKSLAENVGLKDYDHLEPCRIYHAARLVAILEAYALYDPEIGYCQGMSDLLSPIMSVMEDDDEAFWCFVGFMKKARHNFRLDEVGIRRQLNIVSKIIKCKDSHLYSHLEQLQAEDCFFVYRMVVVLFRRELNFDQTMCLWEVIWADQAAIRAGIARSAWGRMRLRAPPTEDLLLYAIAACVLQRRKLIIEKYSSMEDIMRECNSMAGHLDVWKLLDDAHDLVVTLHDKI